MKTLYLAGLLLTTISSICSAQQNIPVTVAVNKLSGFIEIRNSNAGVVLPSEKKLLSAGRLLAPVQSFIYSNGTHSDNSINYLNTNLQSTTASVKIISQSANAVIVKVSYQFVQKNFSYVKSGNKKVPSGTGYYTCTIQVRRGEKTIAIEEESNIDISWSVKISNGLSPDKARYRGWAAISTKYGYEPNGGVYRDEIARGYPMDATVDLDYSKSFTYPALTLWEPLGGENNTGRYWQVYNGRAGSESNLFGFFQGKPGRLLGANGLGTALRLEPTEGPGEKQIAELQISIDQHWPPEKWYARKRFQWVAFISTKRDLLSPEKSQPIAKAMNRVSGLGEEVEQYSNEPVKLIPSFYTGAIYMPAEKVTALRKKIKEDLRFFEKIYAMEPNYGAIWYAWRNADSARSLIRQLLKLRTDLVSIYTEQEGTYDQRYRYWSGALFFKYYALAVSCLFADPTISISAGDRKKLEQLVGLMAKIVWSENNVPLSDSAGVNLGPANMPFQYRNNARIFFSLLLAADPAFQAHAKQTVASIQRDINDAIYENGAGIGSPHYTQSTIDPILSSMLQLRHAGVADLFKTNKRVEKFAAFYTSLVTPPSVRFMGYRKLVAFGDGSEESAATFALLANGLNTLNPGLSARLLSIYNYGPPRRSMAGSVVLAIDLASQPENQFSIGSSNFTGYLSHFRSGVQTRGAETAVWVLNGDGYYDHRNDDAGQAAIYALEAPLSINWSCFYSPQVADARMKCTVVPESVFPEWQTTNQPLAARSLTNRTWPTSTLQQFASFKYASTTLVLMKRDKQEWYRRVYMIWLQEKEPVIVFYDSLQQQEAAIWTMPMMSEGDVSTPAGNISPVKKLHNNADRKELPSATPVQTVQPGLNRFTFRGQNWKTHNTGGIDWHLYTCSNRPLNFTLSSWANTWQNSPEQNEFAKTNGRPYMEEQQLIRIKSNRPFFNILLPFNKGNDPYARRVSQVADNRVAIEKRNGTMELSPEIAWFKAQEDQYICLLSEGAIFRKAGWEAFGGCMEIEFKAGKLMIRVHGNSGKRTVVLPFSVRAGGQYGEVSLASAGRGTRVSIQYQSSGNDLTGNTTGYTEYVFAVK